MHKVSIFFKPPDSLDQLLIVWNRLFLGNIRKNHILKRLWNAIPKNRCWQIWLARNRSIFKGEKVIINPIAAKIVGMTAEKLATRGLGFLDAEDIPTHVSKWCIIFFQRSSPQSKIYNRRQSWEIRKNYDDLSRWIKDLNSFSLFLMGPQKATQGRKV